MTTPALQQEKIILYLKNIKKILYYLGLEGWGKQPLPDFEKSVLSPWDLPITHQNCGGKK